MARLAALAWCTAGKNASNLTGVSMLTLMSVLVAVPTCAFKATGSLLDADATSGGIVAAVHQFAQPCSLRGGQVIYREGEDANRVFILSSGLVRSRVTLSNGRRQIVSFHETGDLIGVTSAAAYNETTEAVTSVNAQVVTRERFVRLLDENSHVRAHVISWSFRNLEAARRHALTVGRMTAHERLSFFLLERTRGKAGFLELQMSRRDIADYLGLTIETVSRTITQLRSEGAIRTMKNGIEVVRPDQLQ